MSKKIIKQFKAFIFVTGGVLLIGLFILVVTNNQSLLYPTVKYRAKFNNVNGLFVGSVVSANGLNVGNIEDIAFGRGGIVITLFVKKDYAKYINQSSTISVKTEGVVGRKYVAITTHQKAAPLSSGEFIPVVSEGNILDFLSSEDGFITNMSAFLHEASVFLSHINKQAEEGKLLTEIGQISRQTRRFFSEDKNQDIKDILVHTKSILRKIDQGHGSLGAVVNDVSLYKKAVSFMDGRPYSKFLDFFIGGRPARDFPPDEDPNQE